MEQEALLGAQQVVTEAEQEPAEAVAEPEAPPEEIAAPVMVQPLAPEEQPLAVVEAPAEPVAEEPEEELSFAEALERFEASRDDDEVVAEGDDERLRKLKEDRRKRQTLVYDEKLGKVVAQKKHKGGKQDWLEGIEEEE
jgi:hypothetical protein